MMTCRELQALLVDQRLGGLSFAVRARIAMHAALCPCCRAMASTYGIVADVSGDLADTPVPEAVVADIETFLAGLDNIS